MTISGLTICFKFAINKTKIHLKKINRGLRFFTLFEFEVKKSFI